MSRTPAVRVHKLTHRYGSRVALDGVSLEVWPGDTFGVLGPNGSGKTTLFRLLATLTPVQEGQVVVLGHTLPQDQAALREKLGVVFQHPSVDGLLSVYENLKCHARLHGLRGFDLEARITQALTWLHLEERAGDRANTLSGGLIRRVELAKVLLSRPRLLVLDEPTTGLDPGSRRELWDHLHVLCKETGMTLMVTTHLLDEAERCSVIALLNKGHVVALDTPDTLKAMVGGFSVTLSARNPARLAARINDRLSAKAVVTAGKVRVERSDGAAFAKVLMDQLGDEIEELTIARPTLEDVFMRLTGDALEGGKI